MQWQDSSYTPWAGGATAALLYACASTDDHSREGLSLPSQLADIRRYAARMDWSIGGEYQDVVSGKREERPGYQELLAEIRRRRSEGQSVAVVVKWLDRLGPSVLDRAGATEELSKLGASIHSAMEGGLVPELIANVLAAVARDESRRHAEQVSGARRHIAEAGWYLPGVAPWGYRWREATAEERAEGAPRKALEEDPATAAYLREAYRRAAAGETIHSIARWAQGLPDAARGGRRMSYQAMRFVLRCPTYIGLAWPEPYDGKRQKPSGPLPTEPGRWPALVDEATWHRAQDLVKRHRSVPRQASGRHLLTGFIRCPRCGARMVGIERTETERLQGKAPSYQCRGAHYYGAAAPDPSCHFAAVKSPVDAAVLAEVLRVLGAATTMDTRLRAAIQTAWRGLRELDSPAEISAQIAQLEREAEKYRFRLTEGARLLVDGALDRAGYERLREAQESNLKAAERELERLRAARPKATLPPLEEVLASAGGWGEAMQSGDVKAQREVLALLVERVVPVRLDRGKYDVEVTWMPLGSALARLAEYRERFGK